MSLERRDDFWGPPEGDDGSDTPPPPGTRGIKRYSMTPLKGEILVLRIYLLRSTKLEMMDGNREKNIIDAIKLAMGEVEFSKIAKDFFMTLAALGAEVYTNERDAAITISNIVNHIKTPIQNVETMNALFNVALNIRMQLVDRLRSRLEGYVIAKILYGYLSKLVASIMKFITDQQGFYEEIIKALKTPPPK
ncbi:hypothetical protein BASA60_004810 [Batrachochytrium salamandrivorans]|nr:hypothetical protein BASA60_004810 [Batrachochytrium salamandrivorans]